MESLIADFIQYFSAIYIELLPARVLQFEKLSALAIMSEVEGAMEEV